MVLTLLFAAISGLITALLAVGGLSLWWILPVWIGFYVAVALVYILLFVGGVCLILPKGDPSPRVRCISHCVIKLTLRWVLTLLGIKVQVTGTDQLPDTSYLLVGNHRSAFDPLCTMAALPSHLVFVCKSGVMNIPVIGTILHRLCFLGIDRENARNAVTTIKRSAELIKDVGLSVGIYPEGTRSKDGNLLPFHAGSFKIAKLADCPVAVVTIRYEKSGILPWNKRVYLHVVEVMNTAYVAENNTATMSERAKTVILQDLGL